MHDVPPRMNGLTLRSLATLEPALAGRARRGLFFPTEAHLAPREALACLVAGLAARGVIETAATTTPDGLAAAYVATGTTIDCRGLSAADALTDLRGVKGEMLMLRSTEVELSRPVRLLPRIPIYLVPRGDGVFMLGRHRSSWKSWSSDSSFCARIIVGGL